MYGESQSLFLLKWDRDRLFSCPWSLSSIVMGAKPETTHRLHPRLLYNAFCPGSPSLAAPVPSNNQEMRGNLHRQAMRLLIRIITR